ncbi:MAG: transcription elongation factor Spt5 [Thermoplasmata archaeon]|nr:transcription elongation factor Spt5 [Thermoplasmata archaeon]
MHGNPNDEGIGLLTGEEAAAPGKAVPKAPVVAGSAPAPAPVPVARVEAPGLIDLKAADEAERAVTAGNVTTLSAVITSRHPDPGTAQLSAEISYASTYPGEGAEWPISWLLPGKKSFAELVSRKVKASISLTPNTPAPLAFQITAPVGVRYGDRVEIHLTAQWDDGSRPTKLGMACIARQAVLAIKTSRYYEREVADTLLTRAEEKRDVLFALLVPAALRGYVFAEGMSFEGVHEMLKGIRKARGLVAGETTLKEVEPLLVPKITVEGFVEGAIVELIAGPFKGEKARVRKIDQAKEEITVELIEAVVPIPVTIRGDHVRMLEKGGGKSGG